MVQTKQQQRNKMPLAAYMGYLFQSFLKRPFGYIVGVLYILYLAIILLIVPSSLHFDPLFIWNVGGFNMPIFNLFFIAAAAASIAVAVFRTSRDDGTELTLSAKPLTKGSTVAIKTLVYLIIMLIICAIITLIVSLIYPVFGEYNETTNRTGITFAKYQALLLSIFVANIVNMLFFGGIAVFISMVGGQVIIMIGTIGIVFLMCLLNFLYPLVAKSATDILSDKYDAEILGYSCNTLHQYEHPEDNQDPLNFATIQCTTDEYWVEGYHYDTYEYWTKAERESGRKTLNYIDIGKQLSSLYNGFGLDDSKLKEASKLVIGTNSSYNYHIDPATHLELIADDPMGNYPISFYGITTSQGMNYPLIVIIGGDMTLTTNNWYAISTLGQVDFNSTVCISSETSGFTPQTGPTLVLQKAWFKMNELALTADQKTASEALYEGAITESPIPHPSDWSVHLRNIIANDTSGQFFPAGTFESLSLPDKFSIIAKNQLYWSILASKTQIDQINRYCHDMHITDVKFPFSSKTVGEWQNSEWLNDNPAESFINNFNTRIFTNNILVQDDPENENAVYSWLNKSTMSYAETLANLYQYTVTSFYNFSNIIAIWTVISCCLFTTAVIVYKKTDFK